MENKIVKIRKLDDIDKNDWEIHFDNETQIVYTHQELFKIVELGLSREKPVIKKEETDTPIFFPKVTLYRFDSGFCPKTIALSMASRAIF